MKCSIRQNIPRFCWTAADRNKIVTVYKNAVQKSRRLHGIFIAYETGKIRRYKFQNTVRNTMFFTAGSYGLRNELPTSIIPFAERKFR